MTLQEKELLAQEYIKIIFCPYKSPERKQRAINKLNELIREVKR